MKFSDTSLRKIFGVKTVARHRVKPYDSLEEYFENPIIHRQIHGRKIYVPLNLDRVWNQVN